MSGPKFQLQRSLRTLVSLALLSMAVPDGARGEEGGGASKDPDPQAAAGTGDDASEPDPSRLEVQRGSDGSRVFNFRPVFHVSQKLKEKLNRYGITYGLEMAFYYQYASRVTSGQQNFGTFSWRLWGSWRFLDTEGSGSFFIDTSFLGSPGLNYDPNDELITRNISSISDLNGNIYPNAAAIDEILIKYVSASTRQVGAVGKIDLANRFDTNRIANDAFLQFTAFALENNLSIPWPNYGGLGAFLRFDFDKRYYVMAGAAASVIDSGFSFGAALGDGNWLEMAEIGTEVEVPSLGVGHYRLTPWHSRSPAGEGWGVGFNFDQELFRPDLVSFFRLGFGEKSATPIQTFVSAGLGWMSPWGRPHDLAGIGMAWSKPSPGQGFQDETLIEVFYRFAIVPWVQVGPDLQVVFNPANAKRKLTVFVPGIRFNMAF